MEIIDEIKPRGEVLISLTSRQRGAKNLYEKKYDGKEYDPLLETALGGVLLSPYEARAAAVIVETRRGWEGPPHVTQIRIVGADLEKAFK